MQRTDDSPRVLAVFLILAGVIGEIAAFALTLEKLHTLTDPGEALSCDFSVLVQCGANLESWQGSVFGFPNPLLGLAGWAAPIAVGVSILAGARFARWFWALFNLGLAGAMALVIWLIGQSIFVLGTLCPWCMVTWAVTIPAFLAVTLYNGSTGTLSRSPGVRRVSLALYGWLVPLTVGCYLVIAVIAQIRLDVLRTF